MFVMEDDNGSHQTYSLGNPVDESGAKSKKEATHLESRVEIDTSPPFVSVMEAVCMFEGKGAWRRRQKISTPNILSDSVDDELTRAEEETLRLEKDLIMKERETLDVLKELDKTKRIIEELKSKLQKGASEDYATPISSTNASTIPVSPVCRRQEISPMKDLSGPHVGTMTEFMDADHLTHSREKDSPPQELVNPVDGTLAAASTLQHKDADTTVTPGEILMQLKKAKVNLSRATGNLWGVRASIKSLNLQLSAEKCSLEQMRERLNSKYTSIASMEEKLNGTLLKLQSFKDAETKGYSDKVDISKALKDLRNEADLYQKMAVVAKSDVLRTMLDIEQTKASIKTAEIRCHAAKKMEDATRASELTLLAEKEALEKSENAETGSLQVEQHSVLMLSHEEYNALASKAKTAEHDAKKRIEAAMLSIDEANASKLEVLKELQRAAEEVKVCREAFQKALIKVDNANNAKLAVEESLRRWRAQNNQHHQSVHSPVKFKNSCPMHRRQRSRNSVVVDVNGVNLIGDESNRVLKPTLSIGQILSRKLMSADSFGIDTEPDPNVSLGQMLRTRNEVVSPQKSEEEALMRRQFSVKRKKLGLPHFSLRLVKGKKKKQKF